MHCIGRIVNIIDTFIYRVFLYNNLLFYAIKQLDIFPRLNTFIQLLSDFVRKEIVEY